MRSGEPLLAPVPIEDGDEEDPKEKPLDQDMWSGESSSPEKKASSSEESRRSPRPPRMDDLSRICRRLFGSSRSSRGNELRRFQKWLFVLGLDQTNRTRLVCSWTIFLLFTFVIPAVSWLFVSCKTCDFKHRHPFQPLVLTAESIIATVSFLCVTNILGKYGLKKVLLLNNLNDEAMPIRHGYEKELQNAFRILAYIVTPCFAVELVHKVWWYAYASVEIPFIPQTRSLNIVLCSGVLIAWLYKATIYLFVCVLFRLMCSLQLLRLEGYIKLLEDTSEVSVILQEHMRIRDQLLMISHRYRVFLILSMLTITFSQLKSLFLVTDSRNVINFFRAGSLAVCSIVQVSGFVVCLHGAAKITHRAQRIMSIVSQWHAVATCRGAILYPNDGPSGSQSIGPAHPLVYNKSHSNLENAIDVGRRTAGLHGHDAEAFHQRQALMDYLQFANAGISLYGFVLDRGFLFAVFGIEFSLTLFILGKTIFLTS